MSGKGREKGGNEFIVQCCLGEDKKERRTERERERERDCVSIVFTTV